MRVYRFWLWVLAFVKGRCADAYINAGACNLRCPACYTWTAETDGPLKAEPFRDGMTLITCRQCGVKNVWCLDAPVPYRPSPPRAESSQ